MGWGGYAQTMVEAMPMDASMGYLTSYRNGNFIALQNANNDTDQKFIKYESNIKY